MCGTLRTARSRPPRSVYDRGMSIDDDTEDLEFDDENGPEAKLDDDDFDDLFSEDPDARRVDDLDDDGDWS